MPERLHSGVIQYDLGKDTDEGLYRKGFLYAPLPLLRSAVETMRTYHLLNDTKINDASCDRTKAVERPPQQPEGAVIHYGLTTSGDGILKSATKRVEAVSRLGDVLYFEMEAVGLMSELSYMTSVACQTTSIFTRMMSGTISPPGQLLCVIRHCYPISVPKSIPTYLPTP
ncbi:hypothetical protein BN1708_008129 [Verticillium longisporum]|uniref:Uncharacterized protein n=1 Tax=Verticillium longisporum TaxID=100787 RepID=A0A0G4N142_VERLO|nr:hypothetical protein BN1708_008129 [Verticillium longisporum]